MSIVLRKIGGRLTPLWRTNGGGALSFGGGGALRLPAFASMLGGALGFVLLVALAILAVAWLASHGVFDSHAGALIGFGIAGETAVLKEKRDALSEKAKLWDEADKLSTVDGKRDMSQKPLLEKLGATDAADAKAKIDSLYLEITDLNQEIDDLHYREMKSGVQVVQTELKKPVRQLMPSTRLGNEPNTFGQMAVDAKGFMEGVREKRYPSRTEVDMDLKTLLQTSAGWQPRTDNGQRLVGAVIRPVQILDLIPADTTDLFEIPWMLETTRTQAAAEVAEAGTYAEDAFVFARQTSPVRKIGSQIPATDEQLADIGVMRSLLDNRLRFGLQARLDQQILVGNGTPPNLTGVVNVAGVQVQAKGADSAANAVFKAITKVRVTGRAIPDLVIIHGLDWQNIRLAQNAQGDYQFGPPTMVGSDTMWGLPVAQSEALTQGTALAGAFQTYSQLYYKKGIEVQVGFINTQFILGEVTLRADLRAAFVVYRPAAFCTVTGL